MPARSALDPALADGAARTGRADILVGIPSFNNAATIAHVVRAVSEGLRTAFPDSRAVIVNADGGSSDGTPSRVVESADGVPAIAGAYRGLPGKGSAFRAIFEVAAQVGARACAVVDSDLRSITPMWVDRLLRPIVEGRADYVTPLYARHKHDGTITNTIAYPLTRALYGLRVRQPIGGEFGFSGELARAFLVGGALAPGTPQGRAPEAELPAPTDVWETDVARFGIDIYMTTTAIARGARVVQAPLGAKIHDPKDPGADLGPMFTQVVGTAFRLAIANATAWRAVEGSRDVGVVGPPLAVEPEAVNASVDILLHTFRDGAAEWRQLWDEALSPSSAEAVRAATRADGAPRQIAGRTWAGIVYDLLLASKRTPDRTSTYVRSLVPLYFGRVAAFIEEAADLDTARSEELVEAQARAFEARKHDLLAGWGA